MDIDGFVEYIFLSSYQIFNHIYIKLNIRFWYKHDLPYRTKQLYCHNNFSIVEFIHLLFNNIYNCLWNQEKKQDHTYFLMAAILVHFSTYLHII